MSSEAVTEARDRPASESPRRQKAGLPQTGPTMAQATPSLSNLSLDVKVLIALEVRGPSEFYPYAILSTKRAKGFTTLGNSSLRSLASTCREFWRLCRPLRWESFRVIPNGRSGYRDLMNFLPSIGRAVKGVQLRLLVGTQWDGTETEAAGLEDYVWFFADVIRLCPNLRACRLDLIPYTSLRAAAATEDLANALGSLKQLSKIEVEALAISKLHMG